MSLVTGNTNKIMYVYSSSPWLQLNIPPKCVRSGSTPGFSFSFFFDGSFMLLVIITMLLLHFQFLHLFGHASHSDASPTMKHLCSLLQLSRLVLYFSAECLLWATQQIYFGKNVLLGKLRGRNYSTKRAVLFGLRVLADQVLIYNRLTCIASFHFSSCNGTMSELIALAHENQCSLL